MADQKLRLIITGSTSGATAEVRKLQRQLDNFASRLNGIGDALTMGVTLPLAAAGAAALRMAVDAEESENLFSVSLGKMEKSARKWSEQFSDSLGLNEYAIRKMLGTFQVMIKNLGVGEKSALGMSQQLTALAYDMASFYNLDVQTAFEKLQAGITGEIEPLKRLGIVLTETMVKEYAYANGIAKRGAALTEAQKVEARYALILKQTTAAQGDLERTNDSSANKLRRLQEQTTELAVTYGTMLIPLMERLVDIGARLADWLDGLNPQQRELALNIALTAAAIGPLLKVVAGLVTAWKAVVGVYAKVTASSAASSAAQVAGNNAVAVSAGRAATSIKGMGVAGQIAAAGGLKALGVRIAALSTTLTLAVAGAGALYLALRKLAKSNYKPDIAGSTAGPAGVRPDSHPRSTEYAAGAVVSARPGGVLARVAEAGDDEAIIPINSRSRSHQLLAMTAQRMGYELVRAFASGGIVRGGAAASVVQPRYRLEAALGDAQQVAATANGAKAIAAAAQLVARAQVALARFDFAAIVREADVSLAENDRELADRTQRLGDDLSKSIQSAWNRYASTLESRAESIREAFGGLFGAVPTRRAEAFAKAQDDARTATEQLAEAERIVAELRASYTTTEAELAAAEERLARAREASASAQTNLTAAESERSGQGMLQRLRDQAVVLREWTDGLGRLAGRGLSGDVIAQLRSGGPGNIEDIRSLMNLSDSDLTEVGSLWAELGTLATSAATTELAPLKAATETEIEGLRSAAATELQGYVEEWRVAHEEIVSNAQTELAKLRFETAEAIKDIENLPARARASALATANGLGWDHQPGAAASPLMATPAPIDLKLVLDIGGAITEQVVRITSDMVRSGSVTARMGVVA